MIDHIKKGTPIAKVEQNSELKQMEGTYNQLSIHKYENNDSLILKNTPEIIIQDSQRKPLLEKPKISQELENRYKSCTGCKEDSISKLQKEVVVIPEDLTLLAPGEEISLDFASLGNKKYLIIKDKISGFLDVRETKNQTVSEGTKYTHDFIFTYGLPYRVEDWIGRLGPSNILNNHGRHILLHAAEDKECKSWFLVLRRLSNQYGLPDPLLVIQSPTSKCK